jgi:hypothetical protein
MGDIMKEKTRLERRTLSPWSLLFHLCGGIVFLSVMLNLEPPQMKEKVTAVPWIRPKGKRRDVESIIRTAGAVFLYHAGRHKGKKREGARDKERKARPINSEKAGL